MWASKKLQAKALVNSPTDKANQQNADDTVSICLECIDRYEL